MSESVIRYLTGNELFVQIDWNDIINLPNYIDDLSGCMACEDIAALSASYSTLVDSISATNYQVSNIQGQINTITTILGTKVSVSTFNNHQHDCRYYTKNQLKFPNNGGEVNWFNLTSLTPAMSAVYYSGITANQLAGITTPVNISSVPASSSNPFATIADVEATINSTTGSPVFITVFDESTVSSLNTYLPRQSINIYDEYYADQGEPITLDWSPITHHIEYFVHRRNPFYTPPVSGASEINWVDEDIDGNKVWIGPRQIFTGGVDGVVFQSGPFTSGRAVSADSTVVGLPDIDDLYNNVASLPNSTREKEFANRQIIVYGGLELGRNLTLLPLTSGSQFISASGASAYLGEVISYGDLTYSGTLSNPNGSFIVDGVTGSISGEGNLVIEGSATLRNSLIVLNTLGTSQLFSVNSSSISGTQSVLNFTDFSVDDGTLTLAGAVNAGGSLETSENLTVAGTGSFGSSVGIGGGVAISQSLTVGNNVTAGGNGYFAGGLGSYNAYGYKGFFGGDVLISGGLTIGSFFEIDNNLDISGNLTVGGNSLLQSNFQTCILPNSLFVVGQGNPSVYTGDAVIASWTDNYLVPKSLDIFTRNMKTSSNIFTMRAAQPNIFSSGFTAGPLGIVQNQSPTTYINGYSSWNGVNIRTVAAPNDVYMDNGTWSGLEITTYLSTLNAIYQDSQYMLFTSNPLAFSKTVFPGLDGNNFPNGSQQFGWIMSDWFRTATEATNNVTFPLHLVASKNYVDYRLAELGVLGTSFQVAPENLGPGAGTRALNDVITWNGTNWVGGTINLNSQLWTNSYISINGDITLSHSVKSACYVLTDGGIDASITVNLPQIQPTDVGQELIIKFLISDAYYPFYIRAFSGDSIDGNAVTAFPVNVPFSSIRMMVSELHSWIVV